MKKHKLTSAGKEAYWNLFINRDDVYLKQNSKGIPSKVNSPLTSDILFNEHANIGAYQLSTDNKVKFALLDIDLDKKIHGKDDFNINDWLSKLQEQARLARSILDASGIKSYTEYSGYKGYHLWIFFSEPIDAGLAKRWMHQIFDNMEKVDPMIEWEIFPKQERLTDAKACGSYVKAPLQIHKKSGKWSYFVDTDFKETDLDLTTILKVSADQLRLQLGPIEKKATGEQFTVPLDIARFDHIVQQCKFVREAIEKAKAGALTGTIGHKKRLALASILKPFGEAGYNELTKILQNVDDYDATMTRKHWDSIDKPPHTCKEICGKNRCDNIIALGGRSPIKFAFDANLGEEPAFVTKGNCYFKRDYKKKTYDKQISTFVIKPKELLILDDSDCLIAEVHNKSGYQYPDIQFENLDWSNRQKFLKAIGRQDCTFTGSENDLQELCSFVNDQTPVRKTGTKIIGVIDDTWVAKNINITNEGTMNPLRIVPYERGADAYYHKISYQAITPEEKNAFLKDFYQSIIHINEPKVILPMIGWFFATVLKTRLETKLDGFPLLFIHGGQGSGKSTTGSLFMRIAGYNDPSPNACTMRPFPLLKLLSSNNSIPVILDEFKVSDMRSDQVDTLFRFMRSSYRGEVEQKGKADQTVEEYRLSAPMVVMGEWNISQPALRERFILLRFSDIVKKNKKMQEAYNAVRMLPLEAFMPSFIEFCLGQDVDELIQFAANLITVDVAPRIRNNMTAMIIGLELFKRYVEQNNMTVEDIDYQSLIASQVENITGNKTGHVKSAVDQLIEELDVMASNKEISDYSDFKLLDDKKHLAIAFNKVYPNFKAYAMRTHWDGDLLDRQSYKELFKDCEYVITESKVTKFNEKSVRCVIIDIEKAKKAGLNFEGLV